MNTIGVLLLAAATSTGDGPFKPHVGGLKLARPHAVANGPAGPLVNGNYPGAPGCGPDGAPLGPGGPGGPGGRRFPNVSSQVYFAEPKGMSIGWQSGGGPGPVDAIYLADQLVAPARYNFRQGYIYRLKVTNLPGDDPGLALYPSLEVAPSTPTTDAYLTHNPIPVQFTTEDLDQVKAGNFITKVIYLPDPKYQELAVSGVETLVSTRLEPGIDPIIEADRRGTILMIVRLGGINLEMNQGMIVNGPAGPGGGPIMTGPGGAPVMMGPNGLMMGGPGGMPTGPMMGGPPPATGGMVGPGGVMGGPAVPPATPAVPVDSAPATIPPPPSGPAAPVAVPSVEAVPQPPQ